VNCCPICKTAGLGSDSGANVSPDDTDTVSPSGRFLRFSQHFSICERASYFLYWVAAQDLCHQACTTFCSSTHLRVPRLATIFQPGIL
jgi:hypothetical protein